MSAASHAASPAVVVPGESSSGLQLGLHPLVIVNVSDHWTRVRMQSGNPGTHVMGALLGVQTGRVVEVFNSFELAFDLVNGQLVLDRDYFLNKQAQFREVFPTYDYLGWYTTGPQVTEAHVAMHQQMLAFNESPLFLLLDTVAGANAKDLPITMYESHIGATRNPPQTIFIKTSYKIETGDAERIAVNHVATLTDTGASAESKAVAHLMSQRSAIVQLHSRIVILRDYVRDVRDGKMPSDSTLLRQIAGLCHRLPAMESGAFRQETIKEQADAHLMTYLATLTRGIHLINEVADKYNMVYERSRRVRAAF